MRTSRGFTLVELMMTVAIIAIVATIGVKMSSKALRGGKAASFSRQLVQVANDARSSSLSLGNVTRLRVVLASGTAQQQTLVPERYNGTTWIATGSPLSTPSGVQLCNVVSNLTAHTATCPASTASRVLFSSTGKVWVVTDDSATVPSTPSGAQLFVRTNEGSNNPKQYKLMLSKLTGLPRLTDQW